MNKQTKKQLHDAFVGHARVTVAVSTGRSETRTVGAESLLNKIAAVRTGLEFAFVCCEQALTLRLSHA